MFSLMRYDIAMVTRRDKSPVSPFTRQLAMVIKGRMAERGVTQTKVAAKLGRSQAYVSERVSGLEAWNTHELSILSEILGYGDPFDMMDDLRMRVGRQ